MFLNREGDDANWILRTLVSDTPLPLRGESFGQDRLQDHARHWAREFKSSVGSTRKAEQQFINRGRENATWLSKEYDRLRARPGQPDSDGAEVEWFLDNYSVVEEQIREIKEDLPLPYFRQLPKSQEGVPRVYLLAEEWIVHTDSALDEQALYGYLQAFHEVTELSIGESWAFPIMLRLALVENLRRLVEQHDVRNRERLVLQQVLIQADRRDLLQLPASFVEHRPALTLDILTLLRTLEGGGSELYPLFEQHLHGLGFSLERLNHLVHQTQAANQVSIGNVITGMRLVSSIDWVACFEATNATEKALREDPSGFYGQMDVQTRDHYRHVVERLARRSPLSEKEVASAAVALARQAIEQGHPVHQCHVGYYLIDDGLATLQAQIQFRDGLFDKIDRWRSANAFLIYVAGMGFCTLELAGLLAWVVTNGHPTEIVWILFALSLLPASELAWEFMNFVTSRCVPPRRLPKLDFPEGIPKSEATLVVVPALISSAEELNTLTLKLEEHYLANRDESLRFALLTDFPDASQETLPTDESVLHVAEQELRRLNEKYASIAGDRFVLLHRRRRWNASEGVWMGWERKRGKLMELGELLIQGKGQSFDWIFGDLSTWRDSNGSFPFKYVITLDADTRLPLGTARKLVGAMSHPLNRARRDEQGKIVAGYAVLQPRVGIDFKSANQTTYARLFAQRPGIDPYSSAASDTYQDLFAEGSFTGKGILDLHAFHTAVQAAFPDNRILSHDLIEGCHSRVGFLNDVELIDGYPARYDADIRRHHRWLRGDWQLLPWLLPRVPTKKGWSPNRLSLLSRWKILDNLRRSLVWPATLILVIAGWFIYPKIAFLFSALPIIVVVLPLLLELGTLGRNLIKSGITEGLLNNRAQTAKRIFFRICVQVSTLPQRAWTASDAVLRTIYRLFISRRKFLEWEPAAVTERRMQGSQWWQPWDVWLGPFTAVCLAASLPKVALVQALPLLCAWIMAPFVIHRISKIHGKSRLRQQLSHEQQSWLRQQARSTWGYFAEFVSARDHWLPPDNIQEVPRHTVAHRVSPTNEGLYLVSALTARDFGFVALYDLVETWERNLTSWQSLETFNGHFYNWYDTTNLRPLSPRYVSTVDSGNLGACLITLVQGIAELRRAPILPQSLWGEVLKGLENDTPESRKDVKIGDGATKSSQSGLAFLKLTFRAANANDCWIEWNSWNSALQLLSDYKTQDAVLNDQGSEWHRVPLDRHVEGGRDPVSNRLMNGLKLDAQSLLSWLPLALELAIDLQDSATNPSRKSVSGARELHDQGTQGNTPDAILAASHAIERILCTSTSPEDIASARELCAPHFATLLRSNGTEHTPRNEQYADRQRWEQLQAAVEHSSREACKLLSRLDRLTKQIHEIIERMDYRFLFNTKRLLFTVGFNVDTGESDRAHYDMFMSEARLATYFAIAKGDVDQRAWFKMGRPVTSIARHHGLLSWGGTMFEYLMPALFHRTYEGTLLASSYDMAVEHQQAYGKSKGLPWGVSESAYAAQAANGDYQYRSFGVPGIGLKRGLALDYVVAPYATCLALDIAPQSAYRNLQHLEQEGGIGRYGFYDALDYSPERVTAKVPLIPVRCYMSHHQGMILVAIANHLLEGNVRRRFHAHPMSRAAELLLQESEPAIAVVSAPSSSEPALDEPTNSGLEWVSRRIVDYHTDVPRTHILSNGQYSLMVTNAGGGYSSWGEMAVTRWRPDTIRDHWGQFLYLRDRNSAKYWSATFQPTRVTPDFYEVTYSVDKAEFLRRDGDIESHLEITISPEEPVELRLLKITNHGTSSRDLDITSYAEIVLARKSADAAHPAFQKLFVETEYDAEKKAILAKRRPRSAKENPIWLVHVVAGSPNVTLGSEFETDRAKFLGRLGSPEKPVGIHSAEPLSGSSGTVLDPVFAIRSLVNLSPGETAVVAFATGVGETREDVLRIAERYHDLRNVQRAFEISWAYHQTVLKHWEISPAQSHLFQRLASGLIYPDRSGRLDASPDRPLFASRPDLWHFGISGDLPLIVVRIRDHVDVPLARELILAHAFWRNQGLEAELAIINDQPASYLDGVQKEIEELIQTLSARLGVQSSNVLLLRSTMMSAVQITALESVAHLVLQGERGTLEEQLHRQATSIPTGVAASPGNPVALLPRGLPSIEHEQLQLWNGYGGFQPERLEYCIRLVGRHATPRPWCNVIANSSFGCIVTESGGGYTWMKNSREFKLTTWENDPVSDAASEHLYIRDEETGDVWRPLTFNDKGLGEVRTSCHGFGYTAFHAESSGLVCRTTISIAATDPIKFICIEVHNKGDRRRRIEVSYAVDWVLGVHRESTQFHLTAEYDQEVDAILARNAFCCDFCNYVAFLKIIGPATFWTANRGQFLGRNGSWESPAAIFAGHLSGKSCGDGEACGAVQSTFELNPNERRQVIVLLGCGEDRTKAVSLLEKYASPAAVHEASSQQIAAWRRSLGTLQITTPWPDLDLLFNGWLMYQVVSCRLWARSGLYQAGGAFGFRDQLQDVMAVAYTLPELTREHILRAAARQFEEGDVQHWWHPPVGQGTRTRCADDLLWLPFVVAHYIRVTGDTAVLDETIPYLKSPPLANSEHDRYETPQVTEEKGSLYEHCLRAIHSGASFGERGLPRMQGGDWNDGMDQVGAGGRGESTWLGWFLLVVLKEFIPFMEQYEDFENVTHFGRMSSALRSAMESQAWDGSWYRRAYFDNGTPLGSHLNSECAIDSLPQSWGVFAAADKTRCQSAMESVWNRLVQEDPALILLFTPPFNQGKLNPGYIQGYPPGIRENGGQYTHGAVWVAKAFAELGDAERAAKLLQMLLPTRHALDPAGTEIYEVEPYVVAADIYSHPRHLGRGGWTWYTGSAAWLYRLILESILGIELRGDCLRVRPCLPPEWPEYTLRLLRNGSEFTICVRQNCEEVGPEAQYIVDGLECHDDWIKLPCDGQSHEILVKLGVAAERTGVLREIQS